MTLRLFSALFSLMTLCFLTTDLSAQDVELRNRSFEDTPRVGSVNFFGIRTPPLKEWFDCGAIYFPRETPPDIHPPKDTLYWENRARASHGNTYMGMVVRINESYESIAQQLDEPLKAGTCYSFSIELMKSKTYKSRVAFDNSPEVQKYTDDPKKKVDYLTPVVLNVWGATDMCGKAQLLAKSEPIKNTSWKVNSLKLEPWEDYNYIMLEAFYNTPILVPYPGHLLMDNASNFKVVECDITQEELLADAVALKEKQNEPKEERPVKQDKKEDEKDEIAEIDEEKDTIVYVKPKPEPKHDHKKPKKPKILHELRRNNLTVGKTIRVKKLSFVADQYAVDSSSYQVINEIYDFLAENKDVYIEIGGHTSGLPSHAFSDSLSTNRAQSVADLLVEKGIETDRLMVKGYGKRQPKFSNNSNAGRQRNQRVEIKILKMD